MDSLHIHPVVRLATHSFGAEVDLAEAGAAAAAAVGPEKGALAQDHPDLADLP